MEGGSRLAGRKDFFHRGMGAAVPFEAAAEIDDPGGVAIEVFEGAPGVVTVVNCEGGIGCEEGFDALADDVAVIVAESDAGVSFAGFKILAKGTLEELLGDGGGMVLGHAAVFESLHGGGDKRFEKTCREIKAGGVEILAAAIDGEHARLSTFEESAGVFQGKAGPLDDKEAVLEARNRTDAAGPGADGFEGPEAGGIE